MMRERYKDRICIDIPLAKCQDPKDICGIMKHWKIKDYVNAFKWQDRILKYGYSADFSGAPGERIYRQAGHLHGWRSPLHGSSGADMLQIRIDFREKYQRELDRNEVVIWVIDMTRRISDPVDYNALAACRELERYLINECVDFSKGAPIGNKDPATLVRAVRAANSEVFDRFFETG